MKLQALMERYEDYAQEVAKLCAEAKPTDGLFGLGDDPRKDPCHMRFYEDVEQWIAEFQGGGPDREEMFEAVRYILETPDLHRDTSCFWFMYAAQGLVRDMIGLLSGAQCALLRESYDRLYPKRDRMPVQKDVYRLLKKGAARG